MRDKHISNEMDRNRKSMQNDYVKKMTAARIFLSKDQNENIEKGIRQNKIESLLDLDDNEYTPMNQNARLNFN